MTFRRFLLFLLLAGRFEEGARTLIVSAGLAASVLPLRPGAVPDLRMVRIGPERVPRTAR